MVGSCLTGQCLTEKLPVGRYSVVEPEISECGTSDAIRGLFSNRTLTREWHTFWLAPQSLRYLKLNTADFLRM